MSVLPESNAPGAEKFAEIRKWADKGMLSFRDSVNYTYDLFWADGPEGAQAICDSLGTSATELFLKFEAAVVFLEGNMPGYVRRDFPCDVEFHQDGTVTCTAFEPEGEPEGEPEE